MTERTDNTPGYPNAVPPDHDVGEPPENITRVGATRVTSADVYVDGATGELRGDVMPSETGWRPDDAEPGECIGGDLDGFTVPFGDEQVVRHPSEFADVLRADPFGRRFFMHDAVECRCGDILDCHSVSPDAAEAWWTVHKPHSSWFVVDSDSKASWAFGHLAEAREEIARCERLATAESARIDAWLADATRGTKHRIAYFEGLLTGYAEELRAEDPKRRAWPTPGGTIRQRKAPDRIVVTDEAAFIEWALAEFREAVKVEPRTSHLSSCDAPEIERDAKGRPKVEGQRSKLALPGADTSGLPEGATVMAVPGVEYVVGVSRIVIDPDLPSDIARDEPEWEAAVAPYLAEPEDDT
jgi:hypothetical protein